MSLPTCFFRQGNEGPEKLGNLLKITHLLSKDLELEPRQSDSRGCSLNYFMHCFPGLIWYYEDYMHSKIQHTHTHTRTPYLAPDLIYRKNSVQFSDLSRR